MLEQEMATMTYTCIPVFCFCCTKKESSRARDTILALVVHMTHTPALRTAQDDPIMAVHLRPQVPKRKQKAATVVSFTRRDLFGNSIAWCSSAPSVHATSLLPRETIQPGDWGYHWQRTSPRMRAVQHRVPTKKLAHRERKHQHMCTTSLLYKDRRFTLVAFTGVGRQATLTAAQSTPKARKREVF